MILGFDTATPATAVAVWAPGGPDVERRHDPPPGERPGHAGRLLALVEEALRAAGADWDRIERIAVGIGPGGFTGLRIGIATARALAQARSLPLAGVSSLDALAAAAREETGADVLTAIDARRGEVFAAAEGWLEPAALAPAALAARVPPGSLAVGDGAVRYRQELEGAGAAVPPDDSPLHRVSAVWVCRLGTLGEPADRDTLLPDYRREPDASPPRLA
jgi:tRNA threonylcarbamoyladenosine biosynthesis protein TsaB